MLLFKQQCYEYFSTYLLCESFFEFCAYEQKYWPQNLHIFIGYCQVAHQNIYTNLYSLPYKSLFLHILSIVRYLKICTNKNGIISAYGSKLHFLNEVDQLFIYLLAIQFSPFMNCLSFSISASVQSLSCVRLFATPWTGAHLAPRSTDFSRQEHCSGLPFPSPLLKTSNMIPYC